MLMHNVVDIRSVIRHPGIGKLCPKTGGEAPKTVREASLIVLCGRHTASHAAGIHTLLGKSPFAAVCSPEASHMGNVS
jgi:hypothetical protein